MNKTVCIDINYTLSTRWRYQNGVTQGEIGVGVLIRFTFFGATLKRLPTHATEKSSPSIDAIVEV